MKRCQAVLIERNPEVESMYAINLNAFVNVGVVPKKKGEYALSYLEKNIRDVDIVITRLVIEGEDTAKMIADFIHKNNLDIPMITLGSNRQLPNHSFIHSIPSGVDLKGVVKLCAQCLGITAQDMVKMEVPEYFPIPINYFSILPYTICDVYNQDLDDPDKYETRLQAQDEIDQDEIKDFIAEGISELYVKKQDRLKFINEVTSYMISLIEEHDLDKEDVLKATELTHQRITEKIGSVGLTPETIELAQKNIRMVEDQVKVAGGRLGKLMKGLLANKASFRFKHTQVTTFVCHHIMQKIDWGTPEQEEKLAFIAYFNDITLTEDKYAMIRSREELKESNLSENEQAIVKKHATEAAELVLKYPHAPMGADTLIRQHHGVLNGIGFSDHYTANLSPSAIVFIIAEEFAKIVILNEGISIDLVVEKLKDTFTTARFKKILSILEEVVI